MKYTKMHGAGNEFVLVEDLSGILEKYDFSSLAVQLCSPKTGPGADGLIVISKADSDDADFRMLFYNADGTLGEMCGNGARCISRYGADHGLVKDVHSIRVRTTAGMVIGKKKSENQYEVRLNDPTFVDLNRTAEVNGITYHCAYVELGNPGIPHAVLFASPDKMLGRALRNHEVFPKGANISFVTVTGNNSASAITYERGVEDFTKACGTGCGSISVVLTLMGIFSPGTIHIKMPGGDLTVCLTNNMGKITDIYLTGPAEYVCEGDFLLQSNIAKK